MDAIIADLVSKFPYISTVLMVVGVLRLVLKPLFSFLHSVVLATPSTKDDELLNKVENGPIVKGLFYVLDWFASIKIQPK